jgi:hypothetical protein
VGVPVLVGVLVGDAVTEEVGVWVLVKLSVLVGVAVRVSVVDGVPEDVAVIEAV